MRGFTGQKKTFVMKKKRKHVDKARTKDFSHQLEHIFSRNLMVTTDHFPGLNVLKGVSSLDTPAERYTKIRDSAR